MSDRLRAVIFDWRGTLVLAPTFRGWVAEALRRIGRDVGQTAGVIGGWTCAVEDARLHLVTALLTPNG